MALIRGTSLSDTLIAPAEVNANRFYVDQFSPLEEVAGGISVSGGLHTIIGGGTTDYIHGGGDGEDSQIRTD